MAYLTSTFVGGTLVVNGKIRIADGIFPMLSNTYDIGSNNMKFDTIYCNNLNGKATNADNASKLSEKSLSKTSSTRDATYIFTWDSTNKILYIL